MHRVPIPSNVHVSSVATGGGVGIFYVKTSVTEVSSWCVPLRGGTELSVRGSGFYPSELIVVRFSHESGVNKLLRGTYVEERGEGEGGAGVERIVRVEAPCFEEEGPGMVKVRALQICYAS